MWIRPRWIYIYVIPIIILTSFYLHKIQIKNSKIIIFSCLFIVISQIISTYLAIEYFFPTKSFASRAVYNIRDVTKFSEQINKLNINKIKIENVNDENNFTGEKLNEGFIINTSKLFCYSPMFGYTLEKLPKNNISNNHLYFSKVKTSKKNYNLFNPSCFLFPKENQCLIGDLFKKSEKENVNKFLNYNPFEFNISIIQKISNYISLFTFIVTLIFLLFLYIKSFIRKINY
jgi:hypothetical protein